MSERKSTTWEKAHVIAIIVAALIGAIPGFFSGRVIVNINNDQQLQAEFDRGFAAGVDSVEDSYIPAQAEQTERPAAPTTTATTQAPRGRVSLNEAAPLFDRVGWYPQVQHRDSVAMGGETFRDVLVLGRTGSGHTFTPASLHNLGRQYSVLSGYVGRVDGTSLRHATIIFRGDGVLLDYIEFYATNMPDSFAVNVEGVQQLRIELEIGGGSSASTPLYAIQAFLE